MEKEKTTQFLMRPKNDFCFKQLMADAQIRQAFLSAVTGIPYEEIEETTLLPTSLEKQYKEDKLGILDVRIQLKNSGQVDVEMQVAAYEYWAERTLFYLSKMFTEQIHEGEGYDVLEKCISGFRTLKYSKIRMHSIPGFTYGRTAGISSTVTSWNCMYWNCRSWQSTSIRRQNC